MIIRRVFFSILLTLGLTGAASAASGVTIFAAASLRGALDAALANTSAEVVISYGGSGAMARQIAAGAPADLIILAHPIWMDWLQKQNATFTAPPRDLLGNRLVLIGPKPTAPLPSVNSQSLQSLLGSGRLAIGQHQSVPAGIYAHQWLTEVGAWNAVSSQLAETDNVRAALALVALGETPLGVVYASDAVAEPAVTVIADIPAALHDPIRYPAAAMTDAGARVLELLYNSQSAAIFASYGFAPIPWDQ